MRGHEVHACQNESMTPLNERIASLLKIATLILIAFLAIPSRAATSSVPLPDGPYVTRIADGAYIARRVEVDVSGARVTEERIKSGGTVTVPAVGTDPPMRIRLRKPADTAPEIVATRPGTPLFIVADTHGEFEIFVQLLRAHRIVSPSLAWSFGRGHLAVLGDVFDRGPHQTEILWLLYKLEAEAERAGGAVHLLLGNHETMVLRGDGRYLHPKYPRTAELLGSSTYAELFGPETVLGQWLRTKPAVCKLDDLLLLHGGISRAIVDRGLTLTDINSSVRAALSQAGPFEEPVELILGSLGPLWYRGYFPEQKDFPAATRDDIDRIRAHFGVRTILVGHTIVPTVTRLYDGNVIAVQVYPHRDEHTGRAVMEAVLVRKGEFLRANIDGQVELLK
jgi:hypothetical protein